MECTLSVGQKVVCVNPSPDVPGRAPIQGEILPHVGEIYTIREVYVCGAFGHIGVRLFEIVNEPQTYIGGVQECGFYAGCFKPLRTTNIEIIEKLKIPNPELEDA